MKNVSKLGKRLKRQVFEKGPRSRFWLESNLKYRMESFGKSSGEYIFKIEMCVIISELFIDGINFERVFKIVQKPVIHQPPLKLKLKHSINGNIPSMGAHRKLHR